MLSNETHVTHTHTCACLDQNLWYQQRLSFSWASVPTGIPLFLPPLLSDASLGLICLRCVFVSCVSHDILTLVIAIIIALITALENVHQEIKQRRGKTWTWIQTTAAENYKGLKHSYWSPAWVCVCVCVWCVCVYLWQQSHGKTKEWQERNFIFLPSERGEDKERRRGCTQYRLKATR